MKVAPRFVRWRPGMHLDTFCRFVMKTPVESIAKDLDVRCGRFTWIQC